MEEWKNIKGYPNYKISNIGRVKSLNYRNTGEERILKGCKTKNGYLQVNLFKEGKVKNFKVHRLVASVFIPNPNNLCEINHIDEDKTNNCVENLEWCNRIYNLNYGSRIERTAKANSIPILQFTKDGEFVRKWDSSIQVERELGIDNSGIIRCCKGKYKSAGGFVWGYADDYERIPFNVFNIEIYRKKVV